MSSNLRPGTSENKAPLPHKACTMHSFTKEFLRLPSTEKGKRSWILIKMMMHIYFLFMVIVRHKWKINIGTNLNQIKLSFLLSSKIIKVNKHLATNFSSLVLISTSPTAVLEPL